MENKFEKIGEGILLGIGMIIGVVLVSTCAIILKSFIDSVLTIF